jgi:hypothetical protein
MKRLIVLGCVGLGLASVAMADKPIKPTPAPAPVAQTSCQFPGTWFGIADPAAPVLTGWVVSVTGFNNSHGTNNLEYPTFDPTLGFLGTPEFGAAKRVSTLRGVWERTGGRTFTYSFMGMAVDENNLPVWIGRVSGDIELSGDCKTEYITAWMDVYLPAVSPFTGAAKYSFPLPPHYGQRYELPAP